MSRFCLNNLHVKIPGAGFTLIEVLLTVAIIGMVTGMGALLVQSFHARPDLDASKGALGSMLRRAQILSVAQVNDSSWGVHLEGGVITLFQGVSWISRVPSSDETYTVPSSITTSGLAEVIFSEVWGLPNTTGTTTLEAQSGGQTHVNVNVMGSVTL
jgi:prepilin-type N-terminal cleavage/methylation domain-containing protein